MDAKRERAMRIALREGAKWGITGSLATGMAVLAANARSAQFRKLMSTSAKMSIPVITLLFFFSFGYEHIANDTINHPEHFGMLDHYVADPAEELAAKNNANLPMSDKMMNFVHDHSLATVGIASVPFIGAIVRQQWMNKHLPISLRLMHSRIMAQAGIIVLAGLTMSIKHSVDKKERMKREGQMGAAKENMKM
jgi:hypothetical protein